jgi:hypothetical protein
VREFNIQIEFSQHSLGHVKQPDGSFKMQRDSHGVVLFMPGWHRSNMRYAGKILGLSNTVSDSVRWDVAIDGQPLKGPLFRRYFVRRGKRCYTLHETFVPGQVVGINCCVPPSFDEQQLLRMMNLIGRYRGISPFLPTQYGFFNVVSIRPRRVVDPNALESAALPAHNSEAKERGSTG